MTGDHTQSFLNNMLLYANPCVSGSTLQVKIHKLPRLQLGHRYSTCRCGSLLCLRTNETHGLGILQHYAVSPTILSLSFHKYLFARQFALSSLLHSPACHKQHYQGFDALESCGKNLANARTWSVGKVCLVKVVTDRYTLQ